MEFIYERVHILFIQTEGNSSWKKIKKNESDKLKSNRRLVSIEYFSSSLFESCAAVGYLQNEKSWRLCSPQCFLRLSLRGRFPSSQ